MKNIEFDPKAFVEYRNWIETDRKIALRISDLIKDILRSPFDGIGKPEALNINSKDIGVGVLIMNTDWYIRLQNLQ